MVKEKTVITGTDRMRLEDMMRALNTVGDPYRSHIRELASALREADFVAATEVARDVITMNSCVRTQDLDSGAAQTFTLVYHDESGMFDSRLSVLTPLGVRVLGSRVGDVVEWPVRRGVRRLKMDEILYQPEAAGDFDL
jgi:regulator of nucleoside diphosphate kinase